MSTHWKKSGEEFKSATTFTFPINSLVGCLAAVEATRRAQFGNMASPQVGTSQAKLSFAKVRKLFVEI